MITLGIDLASQAKGSAACEIRWADGLAFVEMPVQPLTDAAIVPLVERADVTGIDTPLGWPASFVEALTAQRDGRAWPAGESKSFLYRATDAWTHKGTKQQPLSVAADRIAWPAVRAARLLSTLAERGLPIDRSGQTGRVVEVYPAAALRRWASRFSGYKGTDKSEVLRLLAEEIFARDWLRFVDGARERYLRSADAFDALVASLITRAHGVGLCEPIPSAHVALARIEGWIAIPTSGSLDMLPRIADVR